MLFSRPTTMQVPRSARRPSGWCGAGGPACRRDGACSNGDAVPLGFWTPGYVRWRPGPFLVRVLLHAMRGRRRRAGCRPRLLYGMLRCALCWWHTRPCPSRRGIEPDHRGLLLDWRSSRTRPAIRNRRLRAQPAMPATECVVRDELGTHWSCPLCLSLACMLVVAPCAPPPPPLPASPPPPPHLRSCMMSCCSPCLMVQELHHINSVANGLAPGPAGLGKAQMAPPQQMAMT